VLVKTTLVKDLVPRTGAVILSTDKIRKELIPRPKYDWKERKLIYDILILLAKYLSNYHGREDLQRYLISNYIRKSNDTSLMNIIYFLMCYKSCVRGKVSIFRASQLHNPNQKLKCISEANQHFKLATTYLELF